MERVVVAGDKLKNSGISDQALRLTADPSKVEDEEKLVATEVRRGETCLFLYGVCRLCLGFRYLVN